jgi:hypothetical protein
MTSASACRPCRGAGDTETRDMTKVGEVGRLPSVERVARKGRVYSTDRFGEDLKTFAIFQFEFS